MRMNVFQGGAEAKRLAAVDAKEAFSVVDLLNSLIAEASTLRASDIHIAPGAGDTRVRLRIDGVLRDVAVSSKEIHGEIISRIKVLASLRTDEHQAAQDGRFRFDFEDKGSFVDVRVSIVPTYHGEQAVLRLLSGSAEQFTLTTLGFSEDDRKKIETALTHSHGMILATGPTGSGKTTTLYTLLKMLNSKEVSIVTIEDPIEYAIPSIEQIQVNPRTGLTFAHGLRSILRQDPNIIMVGEIRDAETAGIAVNTALTGHLLLSTLHTNDAATTLPRLLDMGIDPYRVASTIAIAIGQRLVRTICETCKIEAEVSPATAALLKSMGLQQPFRAGEKIYQGRGCEACRMTGYRGRMSINEVFVAGPYIKEAILRKASAGELRTLAIENGMTTMLQDGFSKVRGGHTTIEEVLRVIHE